MWLSGLLTVEDDGRTASDWVRALYVVVVTERGTLPQGANASKRPRLASPPSFIDSTMRLLHLPFHLELSSTLPFPLQTEAMWVHMIAREFRSEPIRVAAGAFGTLPRPDTRVDALIAAYTNASNGQPMRAVLCFEAAFEESAIVSDLDGRHLFEAACAASQVLALDPGNEIAVRLGVGWLRDDMRRRADRLATIAVRLVACDEEEAELLVAEQALHSQHLMGIRAEARLATLRETRDYRGLF